MNVGWQQQNRTDSIYRKRVSYAPTHSAVWGGLIFETSHLKVNCTMRLGISFLSILSSLGCPFISWPIIYHVSMYRKLAV